MESEKEERREGPDEEASLATLHWWNNFLLVRIDFRKSSSL